MLIVILSLAGYLQFQQEVPNGVVNRCQTCHISPSGAEGWNAFGLDILRQQIDPDENPETNRNGPGPGGDFTGLPRWDAALCQLDSDDDGQTNGEELGDPECVFTRGAAAARRSDISAPGDAASTSANPDGVDPGEGEGEGEGVDPGDGDDDDGETPVEREPPPAGGCAGVSASSLGLFALLALGRMRRGR